MSRRLSALALLVGGAVLLALPVLFVLEEAVLRSVTVSDAIGVLVMATPQVLVVGLVGFYRATSAVYDLPGRIGIGLLATGLLAQVPILGHGTVVSYTMGPGIMFTGLGMLGVLFVVVGTLGVAVDARRTGVPSGRAHVWLVVALPASALWHYVLVPAVGFESLTATPLGSGLRWLVGPYGLLWLWLGYALAGLHEPAVRARAARSTQTDDAA